MTEKKKIKAVDEGKMGKLLKIKNWSETSLGPFDEWPQTLRTVANILSSTNHPMLLFWGPDYLCLYNDAYSASLKPEKHPDMLGEPGQKLFGDIWDNILPQIQKIMAGKRSAVSKNHMVPNYHSDQIEETYWTYNYSPITSSAKGNTEGVLVICTETTEAVKTEFQLRNSEERMRLLFNSIKDYAIISLDSKRRITGWNEGAARLLGYEEEEIIGESGDIFFIPEDRKRNAPVKEAITAAKEGRAENKRWHLRKDGNRFWGSGLMVPLANSKQEGFVKIFRDRTKERMTEKALEESEQKYRSLFNSIDEGFCIIEKLKTPDDELIDFRYLEVNPAFEKQAGISSARGKTIREVLPDIDESWIEIFDEVTRNRKPLNVEKYLQDIDRTLELHAFPIEEPDEKKIAVLFIDITEQKKTEYFLKKNEERAVFLTTLNDAFRPLYDPIAVQDEAIRILAEHLGVSRAGYGEIERDGRAVIQRDYAAGVPSIAGVLNLQDHDPDMLKALRAGQTVVVRDINEADIKDSQQKAYEAIQVRAHVTVPLLKRGKLIAVLGVQQSEAREWQEEEINIIEETAERTWTAVQHARTEKRLRKSERKYRTLFDSIDEGFCIIEKVNTGRGKPSDFRYIEINPAFEWQSGMPDPVGKTLRELVPDVDPEWIENYEYVLETGEPLRFEITINSPKRIFNLYAFKTGGPKEQKLAVIFNNITEQKQTESDLRKSEERLKAALEGTEVGVWDLDLVHNTAWRSIKHDQIFGYDKMLPEWNYEKFKEHILAEDREKVDQKLFKALSGDGKWDVECRIKRADSAERWISVRGQILQKKEEKEEAKRMVGTVQDITERKKDEEKLQTINETLEERVEQRTSALLSYQAQLRSLASQLSKAEERERHRLAADLHDNLGQLLAMCKMELDLVEGKLDDGSDLDQISTLVNDAISYTRELMSELKPPPSLDQKDISASVDWVAQKMKKHGLEVTISEDDQPKPLSEEIIAELLQSVRESLFNVVKHAKVKEARINISRDGDQVKISIKDKGQGFDASKEKLDITKEGGFGLFSIRERMDLLGGKVEIKSSPGEGTTVYLHAPLLVDEDEELTLRSNGPTRQAEFSYQDSDKIKVLLVDDHKMMLKGLRRIIEQEDDLVVIAEAMNGEDAVNLAHKHSPDVIVMDVDMPVMNGIDATREIVSNIENVRIIGLSLHEKGSVAQAMRNAGASAYLTKTEAFEALSATIRSEAVLAKKQ